MRHLGLCFVVAVIAVNFSGCGKVNGKPQGGIAVVDLDRVAAETGRDRQLAQSLKVAENSLNQAWTKTVENAKDQLEKKQTEFGGDEMSDDKKKEFQGFQQSAVSQLSQIKNKAQMEFEQYKQKAIADYRAELKPIAQEIAAKRGLSVVLPKNEGLLLSVDPGVDITDEVVKIVRERHPTQLVSLTPVPAPEAPQAAPNDASESTETSKPTTAKRPAKSAGSQRASSRETERE